MLDLLRRRITGGSASLGLRGIRTLVIAGGWKGRGITTFRGFPGLALLGDGKVFWDNLVQLAGTLSILLECLDIVRTRENVGDVRLDVVGEFCTSANQKQALEQNKLGFYITKSKVRSPRIQRAWRRRGRRRKVLV